MRAGLVDGAELPSWISKMPVVLPTLEAVTRLEAEARNPDGNWRLPATRRR